MSDIKSFSNEKIKLLKRLRDKKDREKENLFTIEGYREIKRALESEKVNIQQIYYCSDLFLGKNEEKIIKTVREKFKVDKQIFEKISYRDRPDGLIALAELPNWNLPEDYQWENDFYIIIEGVEKPGNLGTILRTAEGAGVSGLIVLDPKIDLFNPNIIRASTGAIFNLPVYQTSIDSLVQLLKKSNHKKVAITPDGAGIYHKSDLRGRIIMVFGSEQYGLTPRLKELCSTSLYIPMRGSMDSLNLAMSCGILLYEKLRQDEA